MNNREQNDAHEAEEALVAKYVEIDDRFNNQGGKKDLKGLMRAKFDCLVYGIEYCTLNYTDDGEPISEKFNPFMDMYEDYDVQCVDIIKKFKPKRYQDESVLENQKLYTKEYAHFESEYKKLLTYCRMAHFFEGNGNPAYHALKLAVVFPNAKSAMDAIYIYAQKRKGLDGARNAVTNIDSCFVHDFCLYDLPQTKPKYWKKWCFLLVSDRMDTNFVKAFAIAGEIESLYEKNNTESFDEDLALLELQENEYLHKIAQVRKEISSARRNTQNAEEVLSLISLLNHTLKSYAMYHKRNNTEFENLSKDSIKGLSLFVKHILNSPESVFNQLGVNVNHLEHFHKLDKTKAGANIPFIKKQKIVVEQNDMKHEFYIQSLDMQEPNDAILAACLGKMTNCCQYLGGYGSSYTEHGLTSPEGGFYVCYQLDKSKPFGLNILAQSWVWRGKKDELVFDSIEYNRFKISCETVSHLFNAILIEIILHKFSNDIQPISSIHCGLGGQTPDVFARPMNVLVSSNESRAIPKDYMGGADSIKQVTLYHPQMQHMLVARFNYAGLGDNKDIFKLIREAILLEVNQNFDIKNSLTIKKMAELLCSNPSIVQAYIMNLKALFLFDKTNDGRSTILLIERSLLSNIELKMMVRMFSTNDFENDPRLYTDKICDLIEKGAHLNLGINIEHEFERYGSLFYKIIHHPKLIVEILKKVNANERLNAIKDKNILKKLMATPGCIESVFEVLDEESKRNLKNKMITYDLHLQTVRDPKLLTTSEDLIDSNKTNGIDDKKRTLRTENIQSPILFTQPSEVFERNDCIALPSARPTL